MVIRLRAGSATDPGRVRTSNQDRVLVIDGLVYAVADGMGGHRGGEVAAQIVVDEFESVHGTRKANGGGNGHDGESPDDDAADAAALTSHELVALVQQANDVVLARADADPELHGMGTTFTGIGLVRPPDDDALVQRGLADMLLSVVNVGDSRVYRLANGELEQLTEDHSIVAELVRDGRLTREEARNHRQRSVLTRALGVEPDLEVDVIEVIPVAGHRFVLCSDGLHGEVPDEVIGATLRRLADPDEAARELVRTAIQRGGRDNVSVIVVDVVDDDDLAGKASRFLVDDAITDDLSNATKPSMPFADATFLDEVATGTAGDLEVDPDVEIDIAAVGLAANVSTGNMIAGGPDVEGRMDIAPDEIMASDVVPGETLAADLPSGEVAVVDASGPGRGTQPPTPSGPRPRKPWPINLRVLVFLAVIAAIVVGVVWVLRNAPTNNENVPATAATTTAAANGLTVTTADPFGPTTKPRAATTRP